MHSFHAKLKTIYLNGKVNRRIDFLIDALLKIEKDTFFKYMGNRRLQCLNRNEIKEANRHERGMAIKFDYITVSTFWYMSHVSNLIKLILQELGPDRWSVKSVSGQISDGYVVVKKFPTCSQCLSEGAHCSATECVFLCLHMYECDSRCFDYTNGHICKHIHRVHSLTREREHENALTDTHLADDPLYFPVHPNQTQGTYIHT